MLARHRAAYASHIRDEADHVFDAVREAIAVAEATGVHVQIPHLKLSGTDNWGGAPRLLAEIEAARRHGLPVDVDAYPYDTATNPLKSLLPRWVMEGGIRPCSSASVVATSARVCAMTSRGTGSPTSAESPRGTWFAWPSPRTYPSTRAAR